jgi:hypothetical protein
MIECDFANSKMQDVLIEGGIKTKCNFKNITILDNVIGIDDDNIISEDENEISFVETLKQLDKNQVLNYDNEEEIIYELQTIYDNKLALIFAKETEEYGEDIWRIMFFVDDNCLLSEIVDSNITSEELYNLLVEFYKSIIKKSEEAGIEFKLLFNTLNKIFSNFTN